MRFFHIFRPLFSRGTSSPETTVATAAVFLLAINIITFAMFGIDKKRAVRDEWRIPERRLFLFSLLGGSIGGILGMIIFRHKTKKPAFFIGLPAILVFQITAAILILRS